MIRAHRNRIAGLDGLRGLAIVLVVVCHNLVNPINADPGSIFAYMQAAGQLSWSGVDLFFVISGYLIGGILIDSRDRPRYYLDFVVRRFCRIMPLYGIVLVAAYALVAVLRVYPDPILAESLVPMPPAWIFATFTQNFVLAVDSKSIAFWLVPMWSLAAEEQFYLTFPLIIRYVPSSKLPWVLIFLLLLSPVLRVAIYSFHIFDEPEKAIYFLMPCRMEPIALGALVAIAARSQKWWAYLSMRKCYVNATFALCVAVLVLFTVLKITTFSLVMIWFGYSIIALAYALLLLIVLLTPGSIIARALSWAPLVYFGSVSYGLYLIHTLVLALSFRVLRLSGIVIYGWLDFAVSIGAISISILIAGLSWNFLERPILIASRRFSHTGLT